MFYTLLKVGTNYGIFNIRFKGPKVWNSISENLKTFSISNFKESVKSDLVKDFNVFLVTCVLISSCVVSQITCKIVFYLLRGSLPKSVPLDFGLEKTFASYFYHQHYYPS